MADYALARRNMVESQIRTNQVVDPDLLAAFGEVPRERCVDPALQPVAYVDEDLALGGGRHLMEPMVLARLIQALDIGASDVVLDVGCGTGYSTAIVSRLAGTVVAVESEPPLAARANGILGELAVDNAVVFEGPLVRGCPAQAPYDAILLNGAVAEIPSALTDQLAEGGRLAAVVDKADVPGPGQAMLVLKSGGTISARPLFDAAVPLLPGFEKQGGFVF